MVEATTSRPLPLANMARRLGVPSVWLREQADEGRIPHLKARDRYLFDAPTVEKIIAEWARGSEPQEARR